MKPSSDVNLRRLACVAQGGHVFEYENPPIGSGKHYGQWPCLHCGTEKTVVYSTTNDCRTCEPYMYADTGSKFGRQP